MPCVYRLLARVGKPTCPNAAPTLTLTHTHTHIYLTHPTKPTKIKQQVLEATGQLSLAYACALTHGLQEEAERLLPLLEGGFYCVRAL